MSIQIMSQVWKHATVSGADLLVLLALADIASDDGRCFPSMTTIAAKARISKRHARRIMRNLESGGLVECEISAAEYSGVNRYLVVTETAKPARKNRPEPSSTPDTHAPPDKLSPRTPTPAPPGQSCPPIHHLPLSNKKIPKKDSPKTPLSVLSPLLGSELAKDIVEHRKMLRKPMTVKAAQLLAGQLQKCSDPKAGAEMMIERGWQSFKAEWLDNARSGTNGGAPPRERMASDGIMAELKREREEEAKAAPGGGR